MYGSDQAASIEPVGVARLMSYMKALDVGLGDGDWTVFDSEEKVKEKLRKK